MAGNRMKLYVHIKLLFVESGEIYKSIRQLTAELHVFAFSRSKRARTQPCRFNTVQCFEFSIFNMSMKLNMYF